MRPIRCTGVWIVLLLVLSTSAAATVHRVPSQYPTIQAGINAAVDSDTVLVADGTYMGAGNRDLDFGGRAIVVMSESGPEATIIDCEGTAQSPHRGFYFHCGEGRGSVVQGFSITNGYANRGGGIHTWYSSATIRGNTITDNEALWGGGIACFDDYSSKIEENVVKENIGSYGGGIYCEDSDPTIVGNLVEANFSYHRGAGIDCVYDSNPRIEGNLITGNSTDERGGGIACYYFSTAPAIAGNTITGNSAQWGGGIHCTSSAHPTALDCILWANDAPAGHEIYLEGGSSIIVTYSDVEGGWPGEGNINADPLFVMGPRGDYYLSQIAAGQPVESPCVDAGDPNSLVPEGTTRTDELPDLWPVDMGYHYPLVPVQGLLAVQVIPDTNQICRGQDLWFSVDMVNLTDTTLTFDAWVDGYYPNGNPYAGNPVLGPVEFTFAGAFGIFGVRRHVHIPLCAPYGGPYRLHVRTGVHPDSTWAEDCFGFAIVPPPLE